MHGYLISTNCISGTILDKVAAMTNEVVPVFRKVYSLGKKTVIQQQQQQSLLYVSTVPWRKHIVTKHIIGDLTCEGLGKPCKKT